MTEDIIVEVEGVGELSFPDGTDPAVIQATVKRLVGGGEQPSQHPHARVARMVGDNLPAIGGAVGGALGAIGGPVVAAGTAALGGAAGRLGQRVIQGVQRRPGAVTDQGEMLADAGKAGAIQGGIQAVGGLVGKGLSAGAKRVYQGLLKPSKALRGQHPDIAGTLVNARAPITQGGARKVEGLLGQSSQQADDLIQANANAAPVRAKEIVGEFGGTIGELRKRAAIGQPSELGKVGERGRRIVQADRGIGIELPRAQELKRTAQNAASAGYRQAERGTVKEVSADTLLDKDVARGLRSAIEKRIPEIAGVNQRTQALGGARDALEDALGREGNNLALGGMRDLIAAGAGGGLGAAVGMPAQGAAAGLLLRMLATPSMGSRAAILVNDAARLGIPTHVLRALMASHEQEQ
jgi:hypothetical protein